MNDLEKIDKTVKRIDEIMKLIDELSKKVDAYTDRQKRVYMNKLNHGFNTTNLYQEARYILEETAEMMRAIEKNDMDNLREELADIVIFAYGLAEIAGVGDLDTEIFNKMSINENRVYKVNKNGDFVKEETEQE